MPDDESIAALHRSGHQFVVATTGGGASAIGDLLRVPGGSQSILAAVVPYSWNALLDWLGGKPDSACSATTARGMAMAAFLQARKLADAAPAERLLGVGCTASLASDRPKRGAHRFYVAVQGQDFTWCGGWELQKNHRSRAAEESLVSAHVIAHMARHARLAFRLPEDFDTPELCLVDQFAQATAPQAQLLLGEVAAIPATASATKPPRVVFPGAFNPMHAGHRQMVKVASARLKAKVAFEISIDNVDKPPLDYYEVQQRLSGFDVADAVWLTRAPTFAQKAKRFPAATFIVGADTLRRIADGIYYASAAARDQAIDTIAAHGCRFLVFGRAADEAFQTLDSLALPPALRALCEQVPESDFRVDLSSTQLRATGEHD